MKTLFTEKVIWINNDVARPAKSGRHLTRHFYEIDGEEHWYEEYLNYSKKHDAWNAQDHNDEAENAMEITYWAYIEDEEGGVE